MQFAALERRRVAVWGFGREGRSDLAALRRHLPRQTFTLFCSADEAAALTDTRHVDVRDATPDAATLGAFDVVLKSPGVSIYKPEIVAAQRQGTAFTSGTALWFGEHLDARVIGITGSKGKSTTSAMAAHVARASGLRTALAGNIGLPLLELDEHQAQLWIVELSSFQTADAGPLEVGVVTSLFEEHLDWHGTRERYFTDKLKLADVARTLVVHAAQTELMARTARHPHRILFGGQDGWHLAAGTHGGESIWHDDRERFACASIPAPGRHNALNACAALTALQLAAVDVDKMAPALTSFRPLPHRLQHLGERDGWLWVDDSISTTPQAALAALDSMAGRPVTLILGGFDRGLDWSGFVAAIAGRRDVRVVTQGAIGPRLATAMRAAGEAAMLHEASRLDPAVTLARDITPAGGAIVLSPGAPSFDQFPNYAARGRTFAQLAGFDPAITGTITGLGIA